MATNVTWRRFAVLCLLLLLAPVGCERIQVTRPVPTGPNVLLVTIDTLRADRVGAYGREDAATPTLDALAARGVLFETSIATAPLTLPSHATILTGRTPPRHGVRHNGIFRLSQDIPTLAQRLHEEGYETGAVVAAVVLAKHYGLERGFEHYDDEVSPSRAANIGGYHERNAEAVTDAALAWLQKRERPFFLWTHYYDPHASYKAPEPYGSEYAADPYQGEIAYTDAQVGRLLDGIAARGRLEDTLVVVTSDHGENLGAHGERTHAYLIYDETQRVPLLMAGPGLPAGRRVPALSSGADVAPTLLAQLGLAPLPGIDGRDLTASIHADGRADPGREPRAVYAESLANRYDHGFAPLYAARSESHLYIRAPRPELYHLERDPGQLENLLPAGAGEDSARLSRFLDEVLAAELDHGPIDVDAATRVQLNALGYAIPDEAPVQSDIDPKDGIRLVEAFRVAQGFYSAERHEDSLRLAQQLQVDWPDSVWLNNLLVMVLVALDRPDEAMPYAVHGLALAPESARSWFILGLAREEQGRSAEAVAACERALEFDPDLASAHSCMIVKLKVGGSLAEARQHAERAVSINPVDVQIRRSVADHFARLGQPQLALRYYRDAVRLDPDDVVGHYGVALNAARVGAWDLVDTHLPKAGERGAGLEGRIRMAVALAAGDDPGRAEAILRGVLVEHPANHGARALLARILDETGRGEEAGELRSGLTPRGSG